MKNEIMNFFAKGTNLLLDHGITLIQWGDQVHVHWGYPAVIFAYDFAVEDSRLEEAARLIENSDTGFKSISPSLGVRAQGALLVKGYRFIHQADNQNYPTHLHLVPESLVHLSVHQADLVPSPFDPTREVHRPRLPELCISLIRCMEDYRENSMDRWPAKHSLLILIGAAIFREPNMGGKIYIPEEETESEEDYKKKQDKAIQEIEAWELTKDDEPYRPKLIKFLLRSPGS
ncbi:hypothetical protein TWF481_007097 [Arthrobotrys musiformis]|uniref:Uncharacterized protein n=1 Tax=Arthrobotrys musiformis TaxID=47236 RepID=A0AAV9WAE5_9PEZI